MMRLLYVALAFIATKRPVLMTAGRRDWLEGQERFVNEFADAREAEARAAEQMGQGGQP